MMLVKYRLRWVYIAISKVWFLIKTVECVNCMIMRINFFNFVSKMDKYK